jgi:hypothetical protein
MDTKVEEQKVFTYRTRSLDEFAVALALGAKVVGVERREDERFFTFHLEGEFDMEKTSLELASRTLTINAYDLCEGLRRAKAVVHQK